MMRAILLALALSGCTQAQLDAWSAAFPTPEQQCTSGGGTWHTVTVYDDKGDSHTKEECVN